MRVPRHAPLRRRSVLALSGAGLVAAALPGWAEAPAVLRGAPATETLEGAAFGTAWRVTVPAGSGAGRLRAPIAAALDRIDRRMSPWRADSEISRFNAAGTGSRPVSPETASVARAALDMAAASGGAFDPTVGPLVARWGFGPIAGEAGSWQALGAGDGTLEKDAPGLTLDLCGIAKGYALDRVAALVAETANDALVDLGGELRAHGRHPSGRRWRVGVESGEGPALAARLVLDGRAVATSGRTVQGYDLGAHRYSHIIDPATAAPVEGPLLTVSVLADTAMEADGWATACLAAGDRGPALAEARGLAALFVFRDGAGLRTQTTGAMGAVLV